MKNNCLKILLIIGVFFSSNNAFSQQLKLSEKPEEFLLDLQKILAVDNNPISIETEKKFETQWANFSTDQRTKTIAITRKMLSKGYKMPQFYLFLAMLDKAIDKEKFTNPAIDDLLTTSQKLVDNYDLKSASKSFENIKDFLDKRLLYTASYNRLYAVNGTYIIKFLEKKIEQTAPNSITKAEEKSLFDSWDTPSTEINSTAKLESFDKKPLPILGGISVELKDIDLVIATSSDSVFVNKTSGTAAWKEGIFVGKGGKFTWESAKMPQISAVFTDYFFEIRNPKFSADDVTLTYLERLNTPIKGIFEYKSEKRNKNIAPTFPRFMSYQGDAFIKNIDKNIEYKGGFALSGAKIYSSAVNNRFSTISVKKDGKLYFSATSTRFELGDSLVTSKIASFITYIDKDSLYHPAVKLSYNVKNYQLRLNKVEAGGYRESAYSDSYHQLDIKADAMRWDLNKGTMDFLILSGKNINPATFESYDYFDPQAVRALSGSSGFNPLMGSNNYAKNKNRPNFTADEVAAAYKLDPKVTQSSLMDATHLGFLEFNPNTEIFKISRKGAGYLATFNQKRDFDDLLIKSIFNSKDKDSSSNATLNLKDKLLTIRGIRGFSLSDSLKILVLPYDHSVKISKNRVITYDGQLKTGNFRFAGKNLLVDYATFTVSLPKIDSISFIPQSIYRKGGRREIGSFVKYEKAGILYLNDANNKSGRNSFPQFPKLVINEGVSVYFDQPERGKLAYPKSVYFEVPKIDYDSLNTQDIEFAGTFHSGGIFQDFKEKLVVMPDTTIGFSHKVPNDKYTVYGGQSAVKFASNLAMNDKGLHSEGIITHLAATLDATNILFMTDSLMAKGNQGEIKEMTTAKKAYFPQVIIPAYSLKWLVKKDSMLISSKENFDFYTKTTALSGKLIVKTDGLFGIGKIKRTDSEMASEQFKFNKDGFIADKSQLKLYSKTEGAKPVLLGNNVNTNFNISTNMVNITTNAGDFTDSSASNLEFPYAAYKTNIDKAIWSIKDQKITMKGDVNTSVFASTNKKQEGLAFNGGAAIYEIEQQTLNVSDVPFVRSADAKIFPEKGLVAIRRDAEMLPFKNAKLTVDTLNAYHKLINGNIQILSKNRFSGDATYQFVNVRKDTFTIKMGNFELREVLAESSKKRDKQVSYSTVAKANVTVRDSVFLSPKILYRGDITMFASQKNLELDGFVVPELKKYPKLGSNWIVYKGNKSEEISITVDKNLKNEDGVIYAGLFDRANGTGIYPTFLSAKESEDDHAIFIANGTFKRDEPRKLFSILPNETKTLVGNKYEFLDEKGVIEMEGTFDMLNGKNSQYMQTAGFARVRLDTPKHEMNALMVVNFPIQAPFLLNMADKIVKTNLTNGNTEGAIAWNTPEFQNKLVQLVGDNLLEDYKAKSVRQHVALPKLSPKFIAPIVFSDLNLKWSEKHKTFYSVGKLGVSNIGETDINAQLNGFVEIRKIPSGDEVYILLEVSEDVWYYFGYREGQMGVVSSEQNFNDMVTAKTDKAKASKDYSMIGVDFSEAKIFRQDFMKVYLGLDPTKPKPKTAETVTPIKKDEKKKAEEKKDGF